MKTFQNKLLILLISFVMLLSSTNLYAQEDKLDISKMKKEDVLKLTYDQLLNLPFEDLIALADIVGVTAEELLDMILNMEVSTASKKAESVFDSPLSTSVLTKDEILKSGANSIPEALRLVPGIIVREETNGNYDVHIRGNDNVPPGNFNHFSENTMTLVMINNRIVYNYINGGTFWESLPIALNEIERIDIIKGPSSALYGPNAVSGVINIITEKPEGDQMHVDVDARVGNYNTKIASASFDGGFGKFRYKLSGNADFRERFTEDYYSYGQQQYLNKDNLFSIFGYPYATGGRETLPTPELAKDAYAANAYFYYDQNDDLNFSLNGGFQKSTAQTAFFENLATPLANRYSKTSHIDFVTNAYGFTGQFSYQSGEQDLSVGMTKPVIGYDIQNLSLNLEYNYQINDKYAIRPGINYQKTTYDDQDFVNAARAKYTDQSIQGLLNGKQSLTYFGGSLRADLNPFEKLRFIAALRLDKYDKPDDIYFSYQFVGSYKPNDKHLLRAVYSKANRGAFIGSVYADFQNPLGTQFGGYVPIDLGNGLEPVPVIVDQYYQYYVGNENINLLTQDMIEVGHRWKLADNLQTDIDIFYTTSKDFDALVQVGMTQDILNLDVSDPNNPALHVNVHDSLQYQNLEVSSKQIGVSATINYVPFNKLQLRLFGTYQKTDLEDYWTDLTDKNTSVDIEHKWTPSFYGGLVINYAPVEKLNINANLYYYSKQEYNRYVSPFGENGTDKIGDKVILNMNISYKFWMENTVSFNVRNLANNSAREFGFADESAMLYTIGLRVHF